MRERTVLFTATTFAFAAALIVVLAAPAPASAYLGPGGVVSGFGAFVALVGAVLASIFGFIWFPVKRLLRRLRGRAQPTGSGATVRGAETTVE